MNKQTDISCFDILWRWRVTFRATVIPMNLKHGKWLLGLTKSEVCKTGFEITEKNNNLIFSIREEEEPEMWLEVVVSVEKENFICFFQGRSLKL